MNDLGPVSKPYSFIISKDICTSLAVKENIRVRKSINFELEKHEFGTQLHNLPSCRNCKIKFLINTFVHLFKYTAEATRDIEHI